MQEVKQITNFNMSGTEDISLPGHTIIDLVPDGTNIKINKLGYVCEPKGVQLPIVLITNREGDDKRITVYVNKRRGIYEVQTEEFYSEDPEQELIFEPGIVAVSVPNGIQFKLDYAYQVTG